MSLSISIHQKEQQSKSPREKIKSLKLLVKHLRKLEELVMIQEKLLFKRKR